MVVDFGVLGGGVQIRCVTQSVSSGFDALVKAGFTYTNTQRFPGLLCRIDGKPTPAQDPCVNAPPSDRYWGYWTAPAPGGAWTYSDLGAGNRTPPPGSVEGWAFDDGCDRKPGSGPARSAGTTTTRPPATTTTRPVLRRRHPRRRAPETPPSLARAAPAHDHQHDGGRWRRRPDDHHHAAGDRAPEPGERGDDEVAGATAASAARPDDGAGGSPAGALVGGGAVLALVVGGAITARRRRATDEGAG